MNRGVAWIDAGTFESMAEASNFVGAIQRRTGTMIGCPEEVAYRNGWIDDAKLEAAVKKYIKSDYGKYLKKLFI
jgi:glucose-1-phosphate thymidylyltransferase